MSALVALLLVVLTPDVARHEPPESPTDAIDRPIRVDVTTGPGVLGSTSQVFEFDGLSRNTLAFDNNDPQILADDSLVQRRYDSLSRLLEEQQNGRVIAADWFSDAERIALHYPNGRQVNYEHDGLDRIRRIADDSASVTACLVAPLPQGFIAEMEFVGPGRPLQTQLGNGITKTYLDDSGVDAGWDAGRRPAELRHLRDAGGAAQTLIAGFEYTFDREDNPTSEVRTHDPQRQGSAVAYDSLYRVVSFRRDGIPSDPPADPFVVNPAEPSSAWPSSLATKWTRTP